MYYTITTILVYTMYTMAAAKTAAGKYSPRTL